MYTLNPFRSSVQWNAHHMNLCLHFLFKSFCPNFLQWRAKNQTWLCSLWVESNSSILSKFYIKFKVVNLHNFKTLSNPSRQVTFIYIVLFTIQIVQSSFTVVREYSGHCVKIWLMTPVCVQTPTCLTVHLFIHPSNPKEFMRTLLLFGNVFLCGAVEIVQRRGLNFKMWKCIGC